MNAGHTVTKVWHDTVAETNPHSAWNAGLTTGLKEPSGKGGQLIVLHCGNEQGFIPNGLLLFQAKKGTGDYHQEMDGPRFTEWFVDQLLPNIDANSVIIMDNASYHSVRREKIPTSSTLKADIRLWLTSKNIAWNQDMLKAELLQKVREHRHQFESYEIDYLAEQSGHTVLRLPPYHCELNPIEMVWSQVKGHVARNNKKFNLKEAQELFEQGLNQVTAAQWNNYVEHVKSVEDQMWQADGLMEQVHERVVINLGESSSSESEDDGSSEDSD